MLVVGWRSSMYFFHSLNKQSLKVSTSPFSQWAVWAKCCFPEPPASSPEFLAAGPKVLLQGPIEFLPHPSFFLQNCFALLGPASSCHVCLASHKPDMAFWTSSTTNLITDQFPVVSWWTNGRHYEHPLGSHWEGCSSQKHSSSSSCCHCTHEHLSPPVGQ